MPLRLAMLIVLAASGLATIPASAGCAKSTLASGAERFEAKGGEILDRAGKLIWKRCSVGLEWDDAAGVCSGERSYLTHVAAKSAALGAGPKWRLPTFDELLTLLDQECGQPAIDGRFFPDVTGTATDREEEYWSSTPGGIEQMVSVVEFSYGFSDIRTPTFERRARLVRSAD